MVAETWTPFEVDSLIPELGEEVYDKIAKVVRDYAPRSPGAAGGRYANSIEGEPTPEGANVYGAAIPGRFLASGTRAHVIPMPSGYVAFEDEGGETVIRRVDEVHHPGTAPNDYLDRAIEAFDGEADQRLLDLIAARWAEG